MVPMGIGMIAVNAGMMFLNTGIIGNMFVDPLGVRSSGADGYYAG